MPSILYPAALIIGFVALIAGANIFVDGSSFIAKKLRVPPLIIGLTIVALGTSAPELAINITSATQGANEIAFANVIGSNIFNLFAVLGVCALLSPIPVESAVLKRDIPLFIAVSAALLFAVCKADISIFHKNMSAAAGTLSRHSGAFLLIGFIIYTIFLIRSASKRQDESEMTVKPGLSISKSIVFIVAGLALIVGGGSAAVYGARKVAAAFGISETLIGLTVVAIGTSLPELVTSIVAAMKGETELAIGNAVGSSILNLMLILGVSALIRPMDVPIASIYDALIMIGAGIITLIFSLSSGKIKRMEGAIMLIAYIASMVFAIVR